jgi:hypothetical protein
LSTRSTFSGERALSKEHFFERVKLKRWKKEASKGFHLFELWEPIKIEKASRKSGS